MSKKEFYVDQAEFRLKLDKLILLIYVDNLQKIWRNAISSCYIGKHQNVKSFQVIHKHNYAKIHIEKWQVRNTPDFNADFLWMVSDFVFFFQVFCIYKVYNRKKKANIGLGINLVVTHSMGCWDCKLCQMLVFLLQKGSRS